MTDTMQITRPGRYRMRCGEIVVIQDVHERYATGYTEGENKRGVRLYRLDGNTFPPQCSVVAWAGEIE